MTLDGNDHLDWLALVRVRWGRVSKRGEAYVYRGQPFPEVSLVAAALRRLAAAGMLTLVGLDEHGAATVALTEAGLARYQALDVGRRARADPPGDMAP